MTDASRRRVLAVLGAIGSSAVPGSVGHADFVADPGARVAPPLAPGNGELPAGRDDFVWAERPLWDGPALRRNLFAFAGRHDLAAVLAQADPTDGDARDRLAVALEAATDAGATPWLNTGVLRGLTPKQFLDDADARERHLRGLRKTAALYREHAPEGRLILWQEAPVAGDWIESGAWNDAAVGNLRRYGPAVFERQLAAVRSVAPDVDVGIFLHFPYVMESRSPAVFADVMADIAARGATPEFVFTDFYRGWYEKDISAEATDAAVRSLLRSARENSGGLPVYHLMQAHTINPNHTPSKQSMRLDVRTATDAGAAGIGWYARTTYHETERGFAPFVPNDAPASALTDAPTSDTFTVARDRYCYAWMAALADRGSVDLRDRFDLWLHCRDVGFHDHRLEIRTADGWTFVGDFGGYRPQSAHAPAGRDGVTVFRALDAARFAADGDVDLRIATPDESDGGELRAAHALPFSLGGFLTEREATSLVDEGDDPIAPFALETERADARLRPSAAVELSVTVGDREATADPIGLAHPDHGPQIDRLASFESDPSFDPRAAFDLWIEGDGARTPSEYLPGDASPAATATTGEVAVAYGLDRERALGGDPEASLAAIADGAGGGSLYALPYFGRANFLPPERAERLLSTAPETVATYGIAAYRP
jgi:hypothetical protein